MYAQRVFRVDGKEAAFDFIERFGFATLITIEDRRPTISQIPMMGDRGRGVLRGHVARANPHSALIDARRQTAVFTGPNAYVSPDWYADREQVPTWNYLTVHAEGIARVIPDDSGVDSVLSELSDEHESRRRDLDDGEFWKLSKLPAEKLAMLRKALVAFEIAVERIEFKAKLSQNKDAADFGRVMEKLAQGDEMQRAVAAAMLATGAAR